VKLEVEEDLVAAGHEGLDDVRTGAGEQLAPDLETGDGAPEGIGEREGLAGRRHIKRD
jgi:hypothetical protein